KKRIALGEAMQQADEIVAQSVARTEDRVEHCADFVTSEPLDGKRRREARAIEAADQSRETRAGPIAAIGERAADRQRHLAARARSCAPSLEAGGVEHEESGPGSFIGHGTNQARLSHTRLSDNQRHLANAVARALQ